jgi:hypothetical protein
MKNPFLTAIAMAVGIIVLAGYFLTVDMLSALRSILVEWATILVAVALIIGVVNLFAVHWRKVTSGSADGAGGASRIYSLVLVIALSATLIVAGWLGPTHPYALWIFNNIQLPVETSLMAILAVVLVYAGARLFQRRLNLFTVVFLLSAVVVLLVSGPLFGYDLPGLAELRAWIGRVPAAAGARGVILGVALGIVTTGLRLLTGADRPYES